MPVLVPVPLESEAVVAVMEPGFRLDGAVFQRAQRRGHADERAVDEKEEQLDGDEGIGPDQERKDQQGDDAGIARSFLQDSLRKISLDGPGGKPAL